MKHGVYAAVNEKNVVTNIFSDVFRNSSDTDILIKEGEGQEYIYPKYKVLDSNFCHNYKITNGKLVERTAAEKKAELEERSRNTLTTEQKLDDLSVQVAQTTSELKSQNEALLKGNAELNNVLTQLADKLVEAHKSLENVTERLCTQQELNAIILNEMYGILPDEPTDEPTDEPIDEPTDTPTDEGSAE